MGKQRKMFKAAGLTVKPVPGRGEPRLWVRRLVIWRKPDEPPVRDIELRKGLNIVWSPDPVERRRKGDGIGHGAGKTLFCTLIRYCLGEDRFAPDGQRERIKDAFSDGYVGAEVVLDGTAWAILRPLGAKLKHFAVPNGRLEDLITEGGSATGMGPFVQAVQSTLLTQDVVQMVPDHRPSSAWQAALASISRDQGCHLEEVLSWRDAKSASDSPVRAMSKEDRLVTLRLLLGAFVAEEQTLAVKIVEHEVRRADAERERDRLSWAYNRLIHELAGELGLVVNDLPPGDLAIAPIEAAAKTALATTARSKSQGLPTGLPEARKAYETTRDEIERLLTESGQVEAAIRGAQGSKALVEAEMPGANAELDAAGNPVCPICHVLIDKVLAEGCKISLDHCDVVALQRRVNTLKKQRDEAQASVEQHLREQQTLKQSLQHARVRSQQLGNQVRELERDLDRMSAQRRKAQRLVEDAAKLKQLTQDGGKASAGHAKLEEQLKKLRDQAGAYRDKHAKVFERLSVHIEELVKRLLGENATGKLTLDGNGLSVTVDMGGDRTTAAIDALKVVAADLAIMCLSIEGDTKLPAFLIHDSPRESDLGESIYERLFAVALELERIGTGSAPLFQYIVTTTSNPPKELQKKPHCVLTIHGAPANERLLGLDL